jgi:formylmethanofuran dehydrogenase subunit E
MGIDKKIIERRKDSLNRAISFHGHLCLGQVLGVHLAERGLEVIKTTDPKEIIVYVENDRCIADTIQIITGTRLGRRSMKLVNYGKMAATFINTRTGDAYRIWVSGNFTEMTGSISADLHEREKQYTTILEADSDEIVSVQKVSVNIPPMEMPGKPQRTIICFLCKEKVMDGKDVLTEEGSMCQACAGEPYYKIIR